MTQELDAGDILEVQDMAEAIARAEQPLLRARTPLMPPLDLFDALAARAPAPPSSARGRATDDTAGPATPAPAPAVPRYVIVPSTPADDDAYYHPLGRMRSLADVTLDGYRPEPTLLLRARGRRKRLSWILVAVLLPLVVLAGFAMFGHADAASPVAANAVAKPAPPPPPQPVITATAAAPPPIATTPAAKPTDGVPVFDVKSLPSAGARKPRTH